MGPLGRPNPRRRRLTRKLVNRRGEEFASDAKTAHVSASSCFNLLQVRDRQFPFWVIKMSRRNGNHIVRFVDGM